MKVSDLTGPQLDYWVAKADGFNPVLAEGDGGVKCWIGTDKEFQPSTVWADGGPIIEREGIELHCIDRNGRRMSAWAARHASKPLPLAFGPLPLIAAMRAFLTSKFGQEVPDA